MHCLLQKPINFDRENHHIPSDGEVGSATNFGHYQLVYQASAKHWAQKSPMPKSPRREDGCKSIPLSRLRVIVIYLLP